jgi:TonB family protein
LPQSKTLAAAVGVLILAFVTLILAVRPPKPRPAPPAASEAWATVTAEAAELRPEPSFSAPPAGSLPRGTRVAVLANRGRWRQVRVDKGAAGFLAAETVETDAERQARDERGRRVLSFTPVSGVVAEDTDVRLAPFPLAARAERLSRGTTVSIFAVDHDYYAVRGNDGLLAFVRSSDVDLVPPDPSRPAIVPAPGKTIRNVAVTDLAPSLPPPISPEFPLTGAPAAPQESSPAGEEAVVPAVLISKAEPDYPEAARRAGVEGAVVLDATISETGQVIAVAVERGLPLGVTEAAVRAVQSWKYQPARGKGGPVLSHKTIRIVFSLGG